MKLDVIFDTTTFISDSVNEIAIELGLAVLLTALVCWVFLGSLSSTMNVLFAIPMSLLGTIAILYFAGFTLNTFTLLGLSLAVGLVVDDAVMVMENIFRHAEMGKDRVRAAGDGTKEITFAALAATIAVIAIFMPVAFMSGMVGKFFLQFGVTLSVAVAISYVEAITLAPARCAQMLQTTSHEARGLVGRLADRGFDALSRGYARALELALRKPWIVLTTAALVLAAAGFTATRLQQEFVPSQDQSRLSVRLTTTVGATLDETDAYVRRAEKFLQARPEVDHGPLEREPRQREPQRDDGPARAAQDDAIAVLGDHAQRVQLVPGPARVGAGPLAAGLRRQQGIPRRVLGARQRLGHARRARDEDEVRRRGLGAHHRRQQRLPARRAGARGHPRSRAGHRPRRLDQRHREHRELAGGRRRRSASTPRAAAGWTCACASSRRSARGPRTCQTSACGRPAACSCRCRRSSS